MHNIINQTGTIKCIDIKDEKAAIFTIFGGNRNPEVLEYQKKVFQHFGYPVNYFWAEFPGSNHGQLIEYLVKNTLQNIDYFIFVDSDCIPLRKDFLDITIDKIKDCQTLFGICHQANHLKFKHPFVGAPYIAFSKKLYVDLGMPNLSDTNPHGDMVEMFTYSCQEGGKQVCFIYPSSFTKLNQEEMDKTGNPENWKINISAEDTINYGLGTQFGNFAFHAYMADVPRSSELFIEKCQEILNNQPWLRKTLDDANQSYQNRPDWAKNPPKLPDWVEEIKEFFPEKYESFVLDIQNGTKHMSQYYLLKAASDKYQGAIFQDLGTDKALSSLILSMNGKNKVHSWDIIDYNRAVKNRISAKYNVEYHVENLLDPRNKSKSLELFRQSSLIYLDIDDHSGTPEREFYDLILSSGGKNEIYFDDIHLNKGMEKFWNSITEEKEDLTNNGGHWSGTGRLFLNHEKKRKIEALVVCVDFSDFLEISLPINKHFFDRILVVTSLNDNKTREICEKNDVDYFPTNLFYKDNSLFNKGLALSEAMNHLEFKDVVCVLDSDIILSTNFREKLDLQNFCDSKFYGFGRHFIYSYEDWLDYQNGIKKLDDFQFIIGTGNGYGQIFSYKELIKKTPPGIPLYSSHPKNVEIDIDVLKRFCPLVDRDPNLVHIDTPCIHLGLHSVWKLGRDKARFDFFNNKKFKDIKRDEIQEYIKEINK